MKKTKGFFKTKAGHQKFKVKSRKVGVDTRDSNRDDVRLDDDEREGVEEGEVEEGEVEDVEEGEVEEGEVEEEVEYEEEPEPAAELKRQVQKLQLLAYDQETSANGDTKTGTRQDSSDANEEKLLDLLGGRNALRAAKGKDPLSREDFLEKLGLKHVDEIAHVELFKEQWGHEPEEADEAMQWFELGNGHYIYVVTREGKLRFQTDDVGHVATANFISKQKQAPQVLAAGEVLVKDDNIVWVDNDSGHYQPSGPSQQRMALAAFERKGWSVGAIYHDVDSTQCPTCGQNHKILTRGKMDKDTKLDLADEHGQSVPLSPPDDEEAVAEEEDL